MTHQPPPRLRPCPPCACSLRCPIPWRASSRPPRPVCRSPSPRSALWPRPPDSSTADHRVHLRRRPKPPPRLRARPAPQSNAERAGRVGASFGVRGTTTILCIDRHRFLFPFACALLCYAESSYYSLIFCKASSPCNGNCNTLQ